jgi:hypothetical protein
MRPVARRRPLAARYPVVEGATISGGAFERSPRHLSGDAAFVGWRHSHSDRRPYSSRMRRNDSNREYG